MSRLWKLQNIRNNITHLTGKVITLENPSPKVKRCAKVITLPVELLLSNFLSPPKFCWLKNDRVEKLCLLRLYLGGAPSLFHFCQKWKGGGHRTPTPISTMRQLYTCLLHKIGLQFKICKSSTNN